MHRLVGRKLLRCGFTTGSCAASAAKAAAILLLSKKSPETVDIMTPQGRPLNIPIASFELTEHWAVCSVAKDSGDDPDITHGAEIFARLSKSQKPGIEILGGEGIGRVTKLGLDQPVGAAAINTVPRRMIESEVEKACKELGYSGGISVTVSIPGGDELAKRTFNPRLGIEGGLSILGTGGIVEPMSDRALTDTIRLELTQLRPKTDSLLLTIGNYGWDYASGNLNLSMDNAMKCSNFVGDALAFAAELDFRRILLVGHLGKLVKLGIGVTNTHSNNGDGRMETLISCALEAGGDISLLRELSGCATTDSASDCLREGGILERTMDILGRRIEDTLAGKLPPDMESGYICFCGPMGSRELMCRSGNAAALCRLWRKT